MANKLFAATKILVHGHRGARALRPENTLPAFDYAIEQGVDCLELDMAVTKDNVVVVSHDPHMAPAFATGPAGTNTIREMTLAQLRTHLVGHGARNHIGGAARSKRHGQTHGASWVRLRERTAYA